MMKTKIRVRQDGGSKPGKSQARNATQTSAAGAAVPEESKPIRSVRVIMRGMDGRFIANLVFPIEVWASIQRALRRKKINFIGLIQEAMWDKVASDLKGGAR